ncbi:ABC transporter permease [Clostridium botulinum]|uniref:hypothetical protein n=1 Tax=Clostridium botulinum TaxID=1491 RepID=UPI00052B6C7A|nr:hypothetical protein [Clostridium botulinum]KGM95277.1 ABC transporter permease [Clostridium botulinum D str. CCUG 7971]KOC46582.1 ABC transporter permease [Clostridium botulinum]NFO98702.1 ABC transporter permease [Clostridium botulinum]OOV50864.1 ABC transporter permease [Clostridium botulinum D/C]OOV54057.1 ABC transporter permease [Clostridium botulinum D/C]
MDNNKEFKSLIIVDKFKWLYSKFGIDYKLMRNILKVKLTTDQRRVPTILNDYRDKKEENNKFNLVIIFYLFIGIFLAFLVGTNKNIIWQMNIYFTVFMFIILSTFISDFSNVILDIRDKVIIGTKGVDSRTLNTAKITHIFIYISSITLSLGGISLIVSLSKGFSFFIMFFIELFLIDLFMILLTTLVYLLVLKFFDGEKLKDMINMVQIILASFMAIGYQFSSRIFQIIDLDAVLNIKLWHYFLPPLWFAAPLHIIKTGEITRALIMLSLLAIFIPIITISIYYKSIPSFERYLEKLNDNSYNTKFKKESLHFKLSKFLCKDKQERAIFNFTCNLIKKEREFKLKNYPNLSLSVLLPFLFIFIGNSKNLPSYKDWKLAMSTSNKYLTLYITVIILSSMIVTIKYCSEYKGAWIYMVSPIKDVSKIFKGSFKGMLYKVMVPLFLFEGILFVFIFNLRVIPHLIIAFLAMIFLCIINFKLTDKELPFSKDFVKSNSGEDFTSTILTIFLGFILSGLHYSLNLCRYGIYIYAMILVSLVILLWRRSFNISWEQLKNKNLN